MGASQQRSHQITLKIQRNLKDMQKQLFDFTKERQTQLTSKLSFPSFVNLYENQNYIQYSLLQDHHNNIFGFDLLSPFSQQIYMRRSQRQDRPKIWKLVSESDQQEIQQGDIIKIGRIQLYFKEFRSINSKKSQLFLRRELEQFHQNNYTSRNLTVSPLKNSGYFGVYQHSRHRESDLMSMGRSSYFMVQSGVSQKSINQNQCRICFDSQNTTANPLFNVCMCSGSVKYVHYECLRSWFRNKTVRYQTPNCIYYNYEPLECQLCKYAISNEVIHKGVRYHLFQYQKIHPPYAKFEHYSDSKIYQILIRLQQSLVIMIGRGNQNDLNLSHSSISRSHCSLFYTTNQLFIKGLPSKYGTFVELKKSVELKNEEPLQFIISNYLLTLTKQPDSSLFPVDCCAAPVNSMLIVE